MKKNNDNSHFSENNSIYVFVLVILFSCIIGYIVNKIISLSNYDNKADISVIINIFHKFIAPEPIERAIYVSLIILILPITIFCLYIIKFISTRLTTNRYNILPIFIELLIACSCLFTFIGSEFSNYIFGKSINENFHFFREYLACVLFAIFFISINYLKINIFHPINFRFFFRFSIFLLILIIEIYNITYWRLFSIDDLITDYKFSQHLDPIMYALGQVSLGAKIYENLPSQYGFYPQLLGVLLPKGSVTLLHITSIFAGVQILTISCCVWLFYRLYESNFLFAATSLAFSMITFGTSLFFAGVTDPYFQYFPLRFLFPALNLCLFYVFIRKPSLLVAATYSIFSVIAIFWNLDTGIVVYFSFLGYSVFQICLNLLYKTNNNKFYLTQTIFILIHIITLVAAVVIFELTYLANLSETVTISSIFNYQRIFYLLGFYMLPLPTQLHSWMAVIVVYVSAIVWGALPNVDGSTDHRRAFAVYLGILGLGLFSYYQGRSHVLNLVSVCWPSVILLGMSADYLWSNRVWLRPYKRGLITLIGVTALLILLDYRLISKTLAYRGVELTSDVLININIQKQRFRNQVVFIRNVSTLEPHCLVLTANQGIYTAELNIRAPYNGPSLIEMILASDLERLKASIREKKFSCVILGISELSKPPLEVMNLEEILNYYRIDQTDFGQDLALLRAK